MGRRFGSWLRAHAGWLAVATLAALAAVGGFRPLQRIDLLLYDAIEPLAVPSAARPQAAIVAIDDASLASLGRWPWNRGLHAELMDRLAAAKAAAVGLAILFPEPAPGDGALAAALARAGNVVLAVAPGVASPGSAGVQEILPVPALAARAAALGHVDVELDADALARRSYRHAGRGAPAWKALSLAVLDQIEARDDRQAAADARRQRPAAASWVREGEMLLPFPDRRTAPPTFSYVDLLDDPGAAARLQGKAVFIGATAAGLDAGLATPGSPHATPMPGVEFHARAFEALRSGLVYRSADVPLTLLFTLLALALPLPLRPLCGARQALAGTGLVLLPALASGLVLNTTRIWIPPAAAMTGLAACQLLWLAGCLALARGSLLHARRHADATLRSIADGVITIDGEGRIVFMNPVAERLTGAASERVRGEPAERFIAGHCADPSPIAGLLAACLADRATHRLAEPIGWSRPDGERCALHLTVTPIGNGGEGAVLALHDVTDTITFTTRLQHEATHDPLTGLPNRTLLVDRLQQALSHCRRTERIVAVLFVDLDRFKRINESLGHQAGDQILKVVATRLQAAVRTEDTVSRWGSDEFVVLLADIDNRAAVATVAGHVLDCLDREVETADGATLLLSGSIGISIGPEDSDDAHALLSMADTAMYRGKLEGGGSFAFYSAAMNSWSRERLSMGGALRRALANHEFELFYQPQIDIAVRRLAGVETLIRWRKPGTGLVRPDLFIPAAEESGVIRGIGEWAIQEAASEAARWIADGLPPVPLAVNVSARQCADMNIVTAIHRALSDSRIDPALLKIELTESTAMRDVDFVATLLDNINQLGVGVSVDDFGTGYSSLSYLRRFPITELKIDKTFVAGIAASSDDAAIVRGTIALAHGLGMTVVAEGVETEGQLRFLAGHACDVAQGYLFARPMPAGDFRDWLTMAPPLPI
jgi:diguanylate cyclase (GGDEF)-like protein/PAS domain S-box-containing protein